MRSEGQSLREARLRGRGGAGEGGEISYGLSLDQSKVWWLGENGILSWPKSGTCVNCAGETGDVCTTVLDLVGGPWFLVGDATYLYWPEYGGGMIRMPKAGGTPQEIDAAASWACKPAVTADRLYFCSSGDIVSCATASACGDKKVIAKNDELNPWGESWGVAFHAGAVYWTDETGGKILRCGTGDCGISSETVGTAQQGTVAIAVDASGVYFADKAGWVYSCPLTRVSPFCAAV